jgi:hypothetical protein
MGGVIIWRSTQHDIKKGDTGKYYQKQDATKIRGRRNKAVWRKNNGNRIEVISERQIQYSVLKRLSNSQNPFCIVAKSKLQSKLHL